MTDVQQRAAANAFIEYWTGHGDEKQEAQCFWIGQLRNVYGVEDLEKAIEFERPVKLTHVSFIDGYIRNQRTDAPTWTTIWLHYLIPVRTV